MLTPSNCRLFSLWRGMTVTNSISQRNAISGGVRLGPSGCAILALSGLSTVKQGREEL